MRHRSIAPFVAALLFSGIVFSQEPPKGVAGLSWMAGSWKGDGLEEHWTRPAGGSMLGMGRAIAGGKTVFREFLAIEERGGATALTVILEGQAPVAFRLVRASEREAVFENPEHDFPQRIIYRREAKDRLFARIEGRENGALRGEDFRFERGKLD